MDQELAQAGSASTATDLPQTQQQIALAHIDDFQWTTLVYLVAVTTAYVGVNILAVQGRMPYALACILNGWLAFCFYMPFHEACHGNISGKHQNRKWVNDAVGWFASIPHQIPYPAHQPMHMLHHAFLNNPAMDPDMDVKGPLGTVVKRWLRYVLISLLPVLPKSLLKNIPDWAKRVSVQKGIRAGGKVRIGFLMVLVAGIALGY